MRCTVGGISWWLRIEYEGAWYHVMNRGRARQAIFAGDADYMTFLEMFGGAATPLSG